MFLIGSLSLMGFPFLSGFYSKDFILETAFSNFNEIGHFAFWLGTVGAFCTSFYSIRLLYFVFLSETNSFKNVIKKCHDVSLIMGLPLGILAFGSIFIGFLTKDMFIGLGTDFWNNSIYINPTNNQIIDSEFLNPLIKLLPVFFSILGMCFAFFLYFLKFKFFYFLKISDKGLLLYNFLNKKWYFDKIYNEFISQYIFNISYNYTYKMIDKGLLELCGPYGLVNFFSFLSLKILKFQTGYIYHYSLIILLSSLILILFLFFSLVFNFNFLIFIFLIIIFLLEK
jgi:NADH-ubiquinone oxidoreductase chain 5